MNKLSFFLLILFIWLQYLLWLGKNGISDWIYTYNVIKLYENIHDISYMRIRNDKLLHEIYDLIHGYEAVEEHARYDLGMIKCDETFYPIKLRELY